MSESEVDGKQNQAIQIESSLLDQNVAQPMDDPFKAEALIKLEVKNFENLVENAKSSFVYNHDSFSSSPVYIRGMLWKICVDLRKNGEEIGLFLECDKNSFYNRTWSCNASAEFRLCSTHDDSKTFKSSIKLHTYDHENDNYGFTLFYKTSNLFDAKDDFIKDDTVCFEAFVKVEVPHSANLKIYAETNGDVTSFRWEIVDLKKQYEEFKDKGESMYSDTFSLISQPDTKFALCVDPEYDFSRQEFISIDLKQLSDEKFVIIDVKLWIESTDGQKFGKTSWSACKFKGIDEVFYFKSISGASYDEFYELYNKNETFFICCELSNLRTRTSDSELFQDYQQNNWMLYEKGIYDAVIKVEDKEYKVLKAFFMGQSEVFQSMFMSNFKEGTTSTINVNDVKKETMEHLIKWFYTTQIEDETQVDDLFVASDKYDIKILKKMCLEIMMENTGEQNVFSRLTLASMHNENRLKQVALGVIASMSKDDFSEFTMSQDWIEFNRNYPKIADEIVNWIREKLKA